MVLEDPRLGRVVEPDPASLGDAFVQAVMSPDTELQRRQRSELSSHFSSEIAWDDLRRLIESAYESRGAIPVLSVRQCHDDQAGSAGSRQYERP